MALMSVWRAHVRNADAEVSTSWRYDRSCVAKTKDRPGSGVDRPLSSYAGGALDDVHGYA